MGKERLIESAKQGLKSTKEFVRRRPFMVEYGTIASASASGLGLSVVHGNLAGEITNSVALLGSTGGIVAETIIRHKLEKARPNTLDSGSQKT